MKYVQLELVSGGQVTIFFNGNLTVQESITGSTVSEPQKREVYVLDGLQNNGGWKVKGTYKNVVNKILFAMGMGVK